MPRNHSLFKKFPLYGSLEISTGKVPTPYHVYDGEGLLIGGTADLGSVQDFLRAEPLQLVRKESRTAMAIWVCSFTDASLGPHHELQFSFFVSEADFDPSDPFGVLRVMTHPGAQMLCHGLWNNTANVVAYNREVLSLNARRAISSINDSPHAFQFYFEDAATSEPVLSGKLNSVRKFSPGAAWEATLSLGWKRVWEMARQPWSKLEILNPAGVGLSHSAVAESYTSNRANRLRYFDSCSDSLEFGATPYARLDFKPQFVSYMSGFNFVYLQPR